MIKLKNSSRQILSKRLPDTGGERCAGLNREKILRACRPAYRRASLPLMRAWTSSGLKEKSTFSYRCNGEINIQLNGEFVLTSWERFCTAACISVLWWLWGCRWSHSPQRPRRSRSRPSSSPSPRRHGWSLWHRWCDVTLSVFGSKQTASVTVKYQHKAVKLESFHQKKWSFTTHKHY